MDTWSIFAAVLGGFLKGLLFAWPVWLMLGAVALLKLGIRQLERNRLSRSGIGEIDRMDGRTFEKYLDALFARLGYAVEVTRYVGDYGADLVTRKDGVRTVIQAKRSRRKVGVKAVQEAVAAKGYYGCDAAMVVTNGTFTQQAVELARRNQVTLWDRDRLVSALLSVREEPSPSRELASPPVRVAAPPTMAPAVEPTTTSCEPSAFDRCATCGKAVSEKVRAYCTAHAGRFRGQVYCYDHQRAVSRSK